MFTILYNFIKREELTPQILLNPLQLFRILFRYRFVHFFFVGGAGVSLNLFVTYLLTHYFFGLENYFTAYLVGVTLNLLYNFWMYTHIVFKTKQRHTLRLVIFVLYSLTLTYLQACLVKYITPIVGLQWYLLVIGGVILFFSFLSFLIFKLSLFREKRSIITST